MPRINKSGVSTKSGVVSIAMEHLIRSDIKVGDEVEISVNSRKEIVIRKVTK